MEVSTIAGCWAPGLGDNNGQLDFTFTDNSLSVSSAPYTFDWQYVENNNYVNGQWISNAASLQESIIDFPPITNFGVTVTNNQGCSAEQYFTINAGLNSPELFVVDYIGESFIEGQGYQGDGEVEILINGGVAPYILRWYDAPTQYITNTTFFENTGSQILLSGTSSDIASLVGLSAGVEYSLIIEDANGCQEFINFSIKNCEQLKPGWEIKQPQFGAIKHVFEPGGGSIDIAIMGSMATGPFTFRWTGPNGFTSNEEDISGLTDAGEYCLVVHDNEGCREEMCIELLDDCPNMELVLRHDNACRESGEGLSKLVFEGLIIEGGQNPVEFVGLNWSHLLPSSGPVASALVAVNRVGNTDEYVLGDVQFGPTEFIPAFGGEVQLELTATLSNGCSISGNAIFSNGISDRFIEPLLFSEVNDYDVYPDHQWPLPLINEFRFYEACGCLFDGQDYECITNSFNKHLIFLPSGDISNNPNASNLCQLGGTITITDGNVSGLGTLSIQIPPNNVGIYITNDNGRCGCIFPPSMILDDFEGSFRRPSTEPNTFVAASLDDYVYVEICDNDIVNPGTDFDITSNNNDNDIVVPDNVAAQCPGEVVLSLIDSDNCSAEFVCLSNGQIIDESNIFYQECYCANSSFNDWICQIRRVCLYNACQDYEIVETYSIFDDCLNLANEFPNCADLAGCQGCRPPSPIQSHDTDETTLGISNNDDFSKGDLLYQVFPNPFSKSISVKLLVSKEVNINVQLIDTNGEVQIEISDNLPLGYSVLDIQLNRDLPSGVYILMIQDEFGIREAHRVVHIN
jgi:hypothetical protein